MSEESQNEVIMWEYIWGTGDQKEMNRLGKQGWEAVGVSTYVDRAIVTAPGRPVTAILYKRRLYPGASKPSGENEAGFRLKQLLEEERAKKENNS